MCSLSGLQKASGPDQSMAPVGCRGGPVCHLYIVKSTVAKHMGNTGTLY